MDRIYKFQAEVSGDTPSKESHPIYDDEYQLLGAFVLDRGQVVLGFVSGRYHSTALHVSTGAPFFFTPFDGEDGKIAYGIVSEVKLSPLSIKTKAK